MPCYKFFDHAAFAHPLVRHTSPAAAIISKCGNTAFGNGTSVDDSIVERVGVMGCAPPTALSVHSPPALIWHTHARMTPGAATWTT
eukprot:4720727-Prymnesium_polylepis.2